MKFSIRTLLVLTLLFALVLLVFRSWERQRQVQMRIQATHVSIALLDTLLASKALTQPTAHPEDELANVRDIHARAAEGFQRLQDKQRSMPAAGDSFVTQPGIDPGSMDAIKAAIEQPADDVVSIRPVASLQLRDKGLKSAIFQIRVPDKRAAWLHVGVTKEPVDTQLFLQEATLPELLDESPFAQTGPFEDKLSPGVHELQVIATQRGQAVHVRLVVDDEVWLESAFQPEKRIILGFASRRKNTPVDITVDQLLPWLFVSEMQVHRSATVPPGKQVHVESMYGWLSDKALDHEPFPGQQR